MNNSANNPADERSTKGYRPSLKTIISLLVIVVSAACFICLLKSSWSSSSVPSVTRDDILDQTRKTASICFLKVFAKGYGLRSDGEDAWYKSTKARGWTADSVIDVIIDLSKLKDGDIELSSQPRGPTKLSITLPLPEFDEKMFSYSPKDSKLVVSHGKIDDSLFRNWSAEAFGEIQDRIKAAVKGSDILTKTAKEAARPAMEQYFRSMGVDEVKVQFSDEVSPPKTSLFSEAETKKQ